MKLWKLTVCKRKDSDGKAERDALLGFAHLIGIHGKRILAVEKNRAEHVFVITGDYVTAEWISKTWEIEHGEPAKDENALYIGVDKIPEDVDARQYARYLKTDAGEIERMLHEAYGRFSDMGKNVVEGIVQGVENRAADFDKDIADAMREAILTMLKTMPTNLVDREKAVEILGKMVDVYLRFRKG